MYTEVYMHCTNAWINMYMYKVRVWNVYTEKREIH